MMKIVIYIAWLGLSFSYISALIPLTEFIPYGINNGDIDLKPQKP